MTSLKTSIKIITYLSDIGCLEIQGASLRYRNSRLSLVLDSPEDQGNDRVCYGEGICKPQDFCRESTYNCYLD
ncbi:hypothetical protein AF482_25755 [Salmonella enterica subsp. enterica serovar Typhimurium]|nr:hypothetical protein [Salmonella enterica subsp. enterica serovar Typhimurium]ECF7230536.1 hypothetical protein [Salmonella enterica subsp. enterica serovar Typhimurium]